MCTMKIFAKEVNSSTSDDFEDVNADIHREYNFLVFKYADLLSKYLTIQREHQELTKDYEEKIREMKELKERFNERVSHFSMP